MVKFFALSVLLVFLTRCIGALRTPVIEIAQGKLRGLALNSHYKYLGIPYASVTTRFEAPGDPPKWTKIFEATRGGDTCKQYLSIFRFPIGSEDCLILNVFTPTDANPRHPLPVMVFIHGGGFYWGGSSALLYEPSPLVAKGVVVVTINYRLGALGFLCLGIEGAPGNAGLKDQVAALRWVNENIKAFGGNPQSVTIFGESAGAASVHYLILSRTTKGLFHRAIIESGSSLSPWAFSRNPIEKASLVAERMGYKTKDPKELLEIFQNSSANAIVTATDTDDVLEQYIFSPCAENNLLKSEPFLTKSPKLILSLGLYNKVPMIMGYNDKEGIRYAGMQNDKSLADYNEHFEELLPVDLVFPNNVEKKEVAERVKQFYFDDKPINKNTIGILVDVFSDTFFHYPTVSTSELHLKTSQQPLYNYYFKYDSLRNLGKLTSKLATQPGASHTDELFYLFQPSFWLVPLVGKDKIMVNRMTQLWTDFAKTSEPTPSPTALIPSPWTRSNSSALDFYTLDEVMAMRPLPNPQRIALWKDIYDKYGT